MRLLPFQQLCSWIIFILLAWYLLLISVHFIGQRPLWNDEACVFSSIREFDAHEMFHKPMLQLQQFPRVYLYLIQQWSQQFDFSVLALRFLPFLCMLGGMGIWFYLAYKEFGLGVRLLTFYLSWCASIPLIYYAAELKQYSMDVFAVSLVIAYCYFQGRYPDRKGQMMAALFLPLLGLFSYPVFIALPLVLYNFFRLKRYAHAGIFAIVLCIVAIFVYLFDIRHSNATFLFKDWGDYFISCESPLEFFKTFGEGVNNLISRWFAESPKWIRAMSRFFVGIGFLTLIVSFWSRFKKDRFLCVHLESIALLLLGGMIFLGLLRKYPFTVPRTSLFFAPILLWMTAVGINKIRDFNRPLGLVILVVFWVYLLYTALGISIVIFSSDLGAQSPIWK